MSEGTVLYDAPGPRAKTVNLLISIVTLALMGFLGWKVYTKFDETGQWEGEKWKPFVESGDLWQNLILNPGMKGTLSAFAVAGILSIVFGLVFGVGRMSPLKWTRWGSGAVIELFRAIPVVILMMFIYYSQPLLGLESNIFMAVVIGLMLYNGSVLAEVIRAGVNSLPGGQREAALAIGLTQGQAMRAVLLPQAIRAMLPAIVAQMVVVLKDTALGYILAYEELLNQIPKIQQNFHNMLPAAIVVASIFILMNLILGGFATWLERFLSQSRKSEGPVAQAADPLLSLPEAGMGGGV
jgi:glutamate transport system permease protein